MSYIGVVLIGSVVLGCLIAACRSGGGTSEIARSSPPVAHGDSLSISGTLVDTRCFSLDPANTAVDHIRPEGFITACAQACANMGFPVAVLIDGKPGNDVWVLITVPAILADYMAETVRVSGIVRSEGVLIPSRVQYLEGDSWLTIM